MTITISSDDLASLGDAEVHAMAAAVRDLAAHFDDCGVAHAWDDVRAGLMRVLFDRRCAQLSDMGHALTGAQRLEVLASLDMEQSWCQALRFDASPATTQPKSRKLRRRMARVGQ